MEDYLQGKIDALSVSTAETFTMLLSSVNALAEKKLPNPDIRDSYKELLRRSLDNNRRSLIENGATEERLRGFDEISSSILS